MKKQLRVFLIPLITLGSLTGCVMQWTSQVLFYQYCNEEGRIGQFIYERVELGPEFFRPLSSTPEKERYFDSIPYFDSEGNKRLIDKAYFNKFYTVTYMDKKMVSQIGPIDSIESTIIRKSDGKLLSKAVNLRNKEARTVGIVSPTPETCPSGKDENGMPSSLKGHLTLIEKTFYLKQ